MSEIDKQSWDRHYGNHLKPHATTAIETAIAEAITRLTGYGYDCRIAKVDFSEDTRKATGAHIELRLVRNMRKDDDSMKSDHERQEEKEEA